MVAEVVVVGRLCVGAEREGERCVLCVCDLWFLPCHPSLYIGFQLDMCLKGEYLFYVVNRVVICWV